MTDPTRSDSAPPPVEPAPPADALAAPPAFPAPPSFPIPPAFPAPPEPPMPSGFAALDPQRPGAPESKAPPTGDPRLAAAPLAVAASPYPVAGQPGQPGYSAGYGGYGVSAPAPYVAYPQPKTNSFAIASMVVSIVGAVMLFCYGVGGPIGAVGAVLGHVARRQIRERQESGDGMALGGVIVGWVSVGLAVVIGGIFVALIIAVANTAPPTEPVQDGFNGDVFDALRLLSA